MKPTSDFNGWLLAGNLPENLSDAQDLAIALSGTTQGMYTTLKLAKPNMTLVVGPNKPDLYVHAASVEGFLAVLRSYLGMDPGDSFEAALQFEKGLSE